MGKLKNGLYPPRAAPGENCGSGARYLGLDSCFKENNYHTSLPTRAFHGLRLRETAIVVHVVCIGCLQFAVKDLIRDTHYLFIPLSKHHSHKDETLFHKM